jgi:hypothetical protein
MKYILLIYLGFNISYAKSQVTVLNPPSAKFYLTRLKILGSQPENFRTDSLNLSVSLTFNHRQEDVKEIYFKIASDSSKSISSIIQSIKIEKINNEFAILGYKNYPYQIPFTPNLYFDFKIINNTNNNFLTISYLNKQNILSQVKHYKIN